MARLLASLLYKHGQGKKKAKKDKKNKKNNAAAAALAAIEEMDAMDSDDPMAALNAKALGVSVEDLTKKAEPAPAPASGGGGGGGGDLIARLEAEKAEAVEAEDYGRAKELKAQIDAAKEASTAAVSHSLTVKPLTAHWVYLSHEFAGEAAERAGGGCRERGREEGWWRERERERWRER